MPQQVAINGCIATMCVCIQESESVLRIPNRAVHLEKRTAEEFLGSWLDQPVSIIRTTRKKRQLHSRLTVLGL